MIDFLAEWNLTLVSLLAGVLGGSVGAAILIVGAAYRLALLPLTLGVALRHQRQRRLRRHIKPEVDRLAEQCADDPSRQALELAALHDRHGDRPFDPRGLVAFGVEKGFMVGFWEAIGRGFGAGVRFLAIPNLGGPSLVAAVVLGALVWLSDLVQPPDPELTLAVHLMIAVFLLLAWQLPGALSLYFAGSSLVGIGESIWVRRRGADRRRLLWRAALKG